MRIEKTKLEGVLIVIPQCFGDNRGWFIESYNMEVFHKHGITQEFIQDNHSFSAKEGVLRGIHFQKAPKAQSKLIRCTRGKILDIAVDLRKNSPTYKDWVAIELSADNKKQLFIPKRFGHGFLTLTNDVEVQYKVDELYSKDHDRSIKWNDPELGVDWRIENPILSEKDLKAPFLKDSDVNF